MKFKSLKITNSEERQIVMQADSEKEEVIYSEYFNPKYTQNYEFVIGLSLSVREWKMSKIEKLVAAASEIFKQYYEEEDYQICIHNKKLEDEVHLHISYVGTQITNEKLQTDFEQLNKRLKNF